MLPMQLQVGIYGLILIILSTLGTSSILLPAVVVASDAIGLVLPAIVTTPTACISIVAACIQVRAATISIAGARYVVC